MTNEIKNRIINLRKQGYGYKKIAKEIGETIGVVRYLCSSLENESTNDRCLGCGVPIRSIKGKKKKQFCSDKCRWNYWNKRKKEENKRAYREVICKFCGRTFMTYGNHQRSFCSIECYKDSRKKVNHHDF